MLTIVETRGRCREYREFTYTPPTLHPLRLLNGQLGSRAPYPLPLQWDWGSRGMETYGLGYAAGSSGVLFSREQSVADPFQPCSSFVFVLFLSMEVGHPAVGLPVAFREKWGIRSMGPRFALGVVILAEGLVLGLRSWGLLNR